MENKTKKAQDILKIINEVIKITGNIILLAGLVLTAYRIRKSYFDKSNDNSKSESDKEDFVETYGERKEDENI